MVMAQVFGQRESERGGEGLREREKGEEGGGGASSPAAPATPTRATTGAWEWETELTPAAVKRLIKQYQTLGYYLKEAI